MRIRPRRAVVLSAVVLTAIAFTQALSPAGAGAVSATKAQLRGDQLRVEGHSRPGVFAIAESTTSAAGARADQNGLFRIQASGFTAPDCRITIRDGFTPTATVTLAGCTPSITPVPAEPAAPSGTCQIVAPTVTTIPVDEPAAVNFETTGCDIAIRFGATPIPVQWKLVAGVLPTGLTGPNFQGPDAANLIGTPSITGTYQFTLQATDQLGDTDQESFTLVVS